MRSWRRPSSPKLVCLSIAPQAHQPTRDFCRSKSVRLERGALHIAGRADRTSQGPRCGVVLTTSAGALPNFVQHGQPQADAMGQAAPLLLRQRSPIICTRPHNSIAHQSRPRLHRKALRSSLECVFGGRDHLRDDAYWGMIASCSSAPTRRQRSGRRHTRDQPIVLLRTKPSDNSTRQVMRAPRHRRDYFQDSDQAVRKSKLRTPISRHGAVDQVRHRRDNFDRDVLDQTSARASPAAQLQDRAAAASR